VPGGELTPSSLHAKHASTYYATTFPAVTWEYQMLGDGNLTAKNFVKSFVVQQASASPCDVLLGPGFSFLAIAMSPLVETPWVDFSATSVELSDKAQHPTFSRVIPTDEVGAEAAAVTLLKLGWTQINILCVDDAYGRSVSAGVSAAITKAGGSVFVSRCLPATTSEEKVKEALAALSKSSSRITFAAMLPTQATAKSIIANALSMEMHKKMVFFWSEAMCSLADRTYAQLHGSLCATYTAKPSVMDPFLLSYRARNQTIDEQLLTAIGDVAPLPLATTDIYAALAHDAAFHAMSAINAHTVAGSSATIVDYLRQHTSSGASGAITLDANGDRVAADAVVYNAQPSSTSASGYEEVTIGSVVGGVFAYDAAMATPPELYFLGARSATFPNDVDSTGERPPGFFSEAIVFGGTGVGVLLILLICGGCVASKLAAPKTRNNNNAPKDGSKPFAIVFTDIESSTALWARSPEVMSDAVELHHEIIRRCLAGNGGYEIKTLGDSFMVAFASCQKAVDFAADVQAGLFAAEWPGKTELDDDYDDLYHDLFKGKPSPAGRHGDARLWNGLRVRIGVHYGMGNVTKDEVTLGYDYYGTVVNTAARVEAAANGGQIVVTDAVLQALAAPETEFAVTALGEHPLKGLDAPTVLHQLVPAALGDRTFGALRTGAAATVKTGGGGDESSDRSDAASMAGGSVASLSGQYDRPGSTDSAARDHSRYSEGLAFVTAFLSPCKAPYRIKTLTHLSTKWRAPIEEGRMAEAEYYSKTLSGLVARTVRTLAAKERRATVLTQALLLQNADDDAAAAAARHEARVRRGSRVQVHGDLVLADVEGGETYTSVVHVASTPDEA
jgi:class 3 adenylate cyclase/ABC-type branched-subunit amino acid transport system substrate-binding protein